MQKQIPTKLKLSSLIILVGILFIAFILSTPSFFQGYTKDGALKILGANYHDALWHIALQESIIRSLSPENPIFAGTKLTGYHFLTDLIMVFVSKITGITIVDIYLKISPVLISLFLTVSTYLLFFKITKKRGIALFSTAVALCTSGFAYLAPLIYEPASDGQSVFWLEQPLRLLTNQQLALSLAVVNTILILVLGSLNKNWKKIAILLGLLVGVKIYSFFIIFPTLLILLFLYLIKGSKEKSVIFKILITSLVIATPLVLFTGLGANGNPFFVKPGWFIATMFESPDRINYPTWEIHRQLYLQTYNYPRLAIHWMFGLIIFLFGNLGIKALGLFLIPFLIVKNKKDKANLILFSTIIIISILIPLIFLQKGVVWNTVQFLHYAQIPLMAVILIFALEFLKKPMVYTLLLIMLILGLPTSVKTYKDDFKRDAYTIIPYSQIFSLRKIAGKNPGSIVYVSSHFYQTSLVPALSKHASFYSDQIIIDILGLDSKWRKQEIYNLENFGIVGCKKGDFLVLQPSLESIATKSAKIIEKNKDIMVAECY